MAGVITTKPTFDRVEARAIPPAAVLENGACHGQDLALFFPEQGERATEARKICGRCDHRAECLNWALDTGQAFGIWGGKSPDERFELIKLRRAA